MKLFLNKTKSEKRKTNKILEKIKILEKLLVNIKYSNSPNKLLNALKELNKLQVIIKKLHEIEQEILVDYTGEFEMDAFLKVGDQIRQTRIRFRFMDDFEVYFNKIGQDYESEESIFKGYIYKLKNSTLRNLIK